MTKTWSNKPAAGNAGFAPRSTIGSHCPGVPEPELRRMSDIRQFRCARLEKMKQRGFWRFVFLRGVLGWGLTMGVIGIIFENVSRKEEAFPWYFVLGLFLFAGFIWGLAMWFVSMRIYSRAPKTG